MIRYPLNEETIREKMLYENVVSHDEFRGTIVYVTVNCSNTYQAFIFSESIIFRRFRLHWQPTYDIDYAATFSVPGKRYYVRLRFEGRYILFPSASDYNTVDRLRISVRQIVGTCVLILGINTIIYVIVVWIRAKAIIRNKVEVFHNETVK